MEIVQEEFKSVDSLLQPKILQNQSSEVIFLQDIDQNSELTNENHKPIYYSRADSLQGNLFCEEIQSFPDTQKDDTIVLTSHLVPSSFCTSIQTPTKLQKLELKKMRKKEQKASVNRLSKPKLYKSQSVAALDT